MRILDLITKNRMDSNDTDIFGLSPSTLALLVIVVFLILWASYKWYYGGVTVPLPSYAIGFTGSQEGFLGGRMKFKEQFGGVAHGAGTPSCLRTSSEGARLVDIFSNKTSRFQEGPDTLNELTILVGKLSCFKKDLVSPSYIVEATRKQPYTTTHDVEPIGETTGRCFSKTLSPRELSISLDKWNSRGEDLVRKLCTAYALDSKEVDSAQQLFRAFMRDITDIARGACLQGDPMIAGKPGPRDAHPYEKPEAIEHGRYTGYY